MRTYVTRSKKLTVTIEVDGVKKNLTFDRGIRHEGLSAVMIDDKKTCKALEACSAFNAEFWFHEERPNQTPTTRPVSEKKIYYKPGMGPKEEGNTPGADDPGPLGKEGEDGLTGTSESQGAISSGIVAATGASIQGAVGGPGLVGQPPVTPTDYPEVTNGQKAKLLLLNLVPGSVHADFNTAEKARNKAKELNITFSNWIPQ